MAVLTKRKVKIVCDSCKRDITNWSTTKTVTELRVDYNVPRTKGKDLCIECNPSVVNEVDEKTMLIKSGDTWCLKTYFSKSIGFTSLSDAISNLGRLNFEREYKSWIMT